MRLEGAGSSKMVQLIREVGKNIDVNIELATVTSPPPELKIKIDNMEAELEKDDLVVAEYLTEHKRKVTIKNEGNTNLNSSKTGVNMSFQENVSEGGFSEPEEEPEESYTFDSFNLSGASIDVENGEFKTEEAEIEFLDQLNIGNRIIVASVNNGQLYVILDRAVVY